MTEHQKPRDEQRDGAAGYRSLFWPLVLIGIGLIWLLANLGIFSAENIVVALRLWPLLLIVAGLDLIFGRRSPQLGALIGAATLMVFLVLMLLGPSLGWVEDVAYKTEVIEEPRGEAQRYTLSLNGGVQEINIEALSDSNALMQAEIDYRADLTYTVDGISERTLAIVATGNVTSGFIPLEWLGIGVDDPSWDIALNPAVPLALDINGGVGTVDLDLASLTLTQLDANLGTGSVEIELPPPTAGTYIVELDGGVGSTEIELPDDVAVQVRASTGVGSVEIDEDDLPRVDDGEDDFVGVDGVWQTPNFDEAEPHIVIHYDGGVGSLTIR